MLQQLLLAVLLRPGDGRRVFKRACILCGGRHFEERGDHRVRGAQRQVVHHLLVSDA